MFFQRNNYKSKITNRMNSNWINSWKHNKIGNMKTNKLKLHFKIEIDKSSNGKLEIVDFKIKSVKVEKWFIIIKNLQKNSMSVDVK